MKWILVPAVFAVVAGLAGVAFANGKDVLEFPNAKGTVIFSHAKHEKLADSDCKVCHENQVGAIRAFGKAYAHRVCIGCHEPEAGKMEGPITCEGCHQTP
ncbi:cytochrome c3 family protein [Geomonas subterranea]|uniref:Cytochrome c family protein n=1 Tax=Geomonas subterranea TaxID=2847989 RepID=A0ABX8LNA5_9BACT|nr:MULTISPECIES: cytochrome c3 family protein [Geomonas]QXE91809.1 cytochrome c family protein [Geomonas subterranea]QXM10098.1 cytochrome c family protein [Geomonas subterranea]